MNQGFELCKGLSLWDAPGETPGTATGTGRAPFFAFVQKPFGLSQTFSPNSRRHREGSEVAGLPGWR